MIFSSTTPAPAKGLNVRDEGLRRLPSKISDDAIWVDVGVDVAR